MSNSPDPASDAAADTPIALQDEVGATRSSGSRSAGAVDIALSEPESGMLSLGDGPHSKSLPPVDDEQTGAGAAPGIAVGDAPESAAAAASESVDLASDQSAWQSAPARGRNADRTAAPPVPVPAPARRSGFGGVVLGGAVAAALGYGGAAYLGDAAWPFRGTSDSGTELAGITTLTDRIVAIEAAVDQARAGLADVTALQADVTALGQTVAALPLAGAASDLPADAQATLTGISEALAALDDRMTALEKRPLASAASSGGTGGVSDAALAAYESELQALRDQIAAAAPATQPAEITAAADAATARIKAAEDEFAALQSAAEAAARASATRAALAGVAIALDAGGDVAAAVSAAQSAGAALVPEDFAAVPTLSDLQTQFPPAARRALAVSLRAVAGEGVTERMGAFLKSQFGARSLDPQQGDGPDAVLSRAEAALGTGDVAGAVALLASLPAEGQEEMADWQVAAESHIAARAALDAAQAALLAN